MKKNRRILLAQCLLVLGINQFMIFNANASVTKVGNGDDGADLEALSPITSGPIFESRKRAVKLLKKLNLVGVPGLGLLIPELERSELLLASQDVHPTGEPRGLLEVSDDHKLVYARTFAEPYAATRFFPSAQKLNSEQLIALQIHEALHRSLPSDFRTNENIVMHLTLAITSPGANFDRIRQTSEIYFKAPPEENAQEHISSVATFTPKQYTLPPKTHARIGYEFDAHSDQKMRVGGNAHNLHGLEFVSSIFGYQMIKGYAVEPVFRARIKFATSFIKEALTIGSSSYDLEARVKTNETTLVGPFARFTAKSIDDKSYADKIDDRDIITLGAFYRTDRDQSYFDSALSYSLPSTAQKGISSIKYKSIFSMSGHSGYKWDELRLGGLAELHSSEGVDWSGSYSLAAFRILAIGPELIYSNDRFQVKVYYKTIVNNTSFDLNDLGDLIDRGSGRSGFGTSLTMALKD